MSISFEEIDKTIGERLRFWRRTVSMSPRNLAKELDISCQQLQKYEKGINRISASKLRRAAEVLRVPIDYFYDHGIVCGASADAASDYQPGVGTEQFSRAASELWSVFNRIQNQPAREAILHLMNDVAASETRAQSVVNRQNDSEAEPSSTPN